VPPPRSPVVVKRERDRDEGAIDRQEQQARDRSAASWFEELGHHPRNRKRANMTPAVESHRSRRRAVNRGEASSPAASRGVLEGSTIATATA